MGGDLRLLLKKGHGRQVRHGRFGRKQLSWLLGWRGILHPEGTDRRAAQGRQMGSASETIANVRSMCSGIFPPSTPMAAPALGSSGGNAPG